jgi:hypothetical protein
LIAAKSAPDDIKPSKIKEGGKGFDEQKYPHSYEVEVTWPDGQKHVDEVKGLNEGHALSRAKGNWEGADIKVLRETTPKEDLSERAKKGLHERSTGDSEADEAIKAGGGIPAGLLGDKETGVKMFHDPQTGTTLGFGPKEQITPEAVKAKLEASREQYKPKEKVINYDDAFKNHEGEQ